MAAGSTASAGAAPSMDGAVADWITAEGIASLLARVAGPLAVMGIFVPTAPMAGRDDDELTDKARETYGIGGSTGHAPPAMPTTPEALLPPLGPAVAPGEGGFTPAPPTPVLPGFTPVPPQATILPGPPATAQAPTILPAKRNDGLQGGARTRSERARKAAGKADPDVPSMLKDADWEAHHLINLAAIRDNPDLFAAAVRAGWRTDDSGNLAATPASIEARKKLNEQSIERPVHDNPHIDWNNEVLNGLRNIERSLNERDFIKGSDEYDQAVKKELERLQKDLRQTMMARKRLTQNDKPIRDVG